MDFAEALRWYNVALVFAPEGNQEAGLAYANRSAVLLQLGHPEEALMDVELARINNHSKPAMLKKRRKKCNEMIDKKNEIREDDEEQKLQNKVEEDIRERQKIREKMVQMESPNPRIPEAADFVTIKYDQVIGSKLVVAQDVPAGTVLMVSRPYVAVLTSKEGWDMEHCTHCLTRIRRGISCSSCVFAFFCSESCRKEAQEEYHKFECTCMDWLHVMDNISVVAFRTVCKAGPKKLFELFESQDPSYFNPMEPYGTEEGCKFNEDPYLAVYHMLTHSEKFNEAHYANSQKTCNAVILSMVLESRSAFFQGIPKGRQPEFKKFVATLIRHHGDALGSNCIPVLEMRDLEGISAADFYTKKFSRQTVPFALGMYPLDGLVNHSCDPNVFFVDDVSKGRKITIALRALQAGEVMYGSYTDGFWDESREYRQQILRNDYHFTCQCIACVNGWPTEERASRVPQFCCPTCSVKYSTDEKASADFKKKCGLSEAGSWKCKTCDQQYFKDTLNLRYAFNVKIVEEADKLLQSNHPCEAIPKLLEAINFFQANLCPPAYVQRSAEQKCARTLTLLFNSLRHF